MSADVVALRKRVKELEAMLRRAQVPVIQAGYSGLGFEIGRLLPSPLEEDVAHVEE